MFKSPQRHTLQQRLETAAQHASKGWLLIKRQRATLESGRLSPGDFTLAEELLSQLEQSQLVHVDVRERLRQELAAIAESESSS